MGPDHNSFLHQILEVVSLTIWYILDISLSSIAVNSTAIEYACFLVREILKYIRDFMSIVQQLKYYVSGGYI